MAMLYLCSTEAGAGKTAVALGLGQYLQHKGYSVGYFKPFGAGADDKDALLARQVLGLTQGADVLCPFSIDQAGTDIASRIADAAKVAGAGKQVVLVEGYRGLDEAPKACTAAQALEAQVLLVVKHAGEGILEAVTAARKALGQSLLGVVLNSVPPSQEYPVRQTLVPTLEARGVRVLGEVPQVRLLLGARVRDVALMVGGTVTDSVGTLDELVESVMLGAPPYSDALQYFGRQANKAVVTRAERPDIQMAALETSTRCLILTGEYDYSVDPSVKARAAERGVSIIRVACDTQTALERAQGAFGQPTLQHGPQTAILEEMVRRHVAVDVLSSALGLK
ncbi:MAG: AAA family ATPase [Bacteroidetes bacterium]|nr:AAA family ATPase [Bacteroidota bacterium]